jgi:pimeloyl-ACP methyl ester carboxylesterase
MELVELDGIALAVHRWGDAGPHVLFWHALGPDPSGLDFEPVAERLIASGLRVTAVDGPGFGASPLLEADGYGLDALASIVAGVVARLHLAPVVVVGHSWGGAIAVRFAASHPDQVEALVLLDSGHMDYADLADVDERTAEEWVEQVRSRGVQRPEAMGRAMSGMTERISGDWPKIDAAGIPTLIFLATVPPHGDQNREHIERFQEALPRAEVRWLDGVSHSMLSDVGAELGDEVAVWLREIK